MRTRLHNGIKIHRPMGAHRRHAQSCHIGSLFLHNRLYHILYYVHVSLRRDRWMQPYSSTQSYYRRPRNVNMKKIAHMRECPYTVHLDSGNVESGLKSKFMPNKQQSCQ